MSYKVKHTKLYIAIACFIAAIGFLTLALTGCTEATVSQPSTVVAKVKPDA